MATLIGVDYGHKKIGFAVGQTITGTARPLSVLFQNGDLWREIDKIFAEWRPAGVVVGRPELADGKPHPLEKCIESFIFKLKARYNVPINRVNEAYTSFEAGLHVDAGKSPVDAHAAAILLESWMRTGAL